jgi:CheY-like chemotaxis protein
MRRRRRRAPLLTSLFCAIDPSSVFGGSGLGLYVCRKLLELMDGKIEVVSLGRQEGSTFRFYVKAAVGAIVREERSSDSPGGGVAGAPPAAANSSLSPTPEAGGRAVHPAQPLSPTATVPTNASTRVLIVEDNVINQRVLDRQLRKAGITADIASDGAEAIEKIVHKATVDKLPYSCVLLDINMPVMDGLTAIRKIRKLESEGAVLGSSGGRTPVFALTGNARQGQIDEALEAGMDDVMCVSSLVLSFSPTSPRRDPS